MNRYKLTDNVDIQRMTEPLKYVHYEAIVEIAQGVIDELLVKNNDLRKGFEESGVLKMRGAMRKLMNSVDKGEPLLASNFYGEFRDILEGKA